MIAPDVLMKPRQFHREIERKQMRIETLRRFAEHLTSPLKEITVKSTPDPTRMQLKHLALAVSKRGGGIFPAAAFQVAQLHQADQPGIRQGGHRDGSVCQRPVQLCFQQGQLLFLVRGFREAEEISYSER